MKEETSFHLLTLFSPGPIGSFPIWLPTYSLLSQLHLADPQFPSLFFSPGKYERFKRHMNNILLSTGPRSLGRSKRDSEREEVVYNKGYSTLFGQSFCSKCPSNSVSFY